MAIKRALISVSDKSGIEDFARELAGLGIEIVSTGGTKALLEEKGIPVTSAADLTGFPEMLDGRVKTLHPAIHGGILALRNKTSHLDHLNQLGFGPIDLVLVNLYPFSKVIQDHNSSFENAVENIDIGGSALLRSAAKNHQFVTVLVDSNDYKIILSQIKKAGDTDLETRKALAAKAFNHTSSYDALISNYLSDNKEEAFPDRYTITFEKIQDLRYGENPHQRAAFYRKTKAFEILGSLPSAIKLHGKELSFNNINDANAALQLIKEFSEPAVIAIKHLNPCGVGSGGTLLEAYKKAYDSDPISIFGGILAFNRTLDEPIAHFLKDLFLEIIIAPDFTEEALQLLRAKKNIRLLKIDNLVQKQNKEMSLTSVKGGMLLQEEDAYSLKKEDLRVVSKRQPTEEEWEDLLFSWKVVKHVKSNAIVLAKDKATVGVGAGQMNRVGACKIALEQANLKAKSASLASDAFFPMSDSLKLAAKFGVSAIIQPGGSIKDQESLQVADENGMAMVLTGVRHFKH